MIIHLFDRALFLRDYWQKKPCVIKQFVVDFSDPIDENDLAGLAQEEDIDCRIVARNAAVGGTDFDWHVAQGPFESFDEHCQGDWSLLVQGVDRYIPEIDTLAKYVDFIPNWRFDDVMVSFSVANAGVGAHTDEYDVFIIQGKGTRRWQVGLPENTSSKPVTPHPLLKQIAGFEPIIDEVLAPGDAVYIPPKHPHNGVALENCMNYSIGFRAPTNLELLSGLLDEIDDLSIEQTRYCDPNIQNLRDGDLSLGEISTRELTQVKEAMLTLLNSEHAEQALLQYLSRQGLPNMGREEGFLLADVKELINAEATLCRLPGVRPIYTRPKKQLGKEFFTFYIDGNQYLVTANIEHVVTALLNADEFLLTPSTCGFDESKLTAFATLVTQLLNAGYWEVSFE